jgi:hypothetical protein
MYLCCECCVLSDRSLCDGPIPRPEESYRVCVCVCDWVWSCAVVTLYTYRLRRNIFSPHSVWNICTANMQEGMIPPNLHNHTQQAARCHDSEDRNIAQPKPRSHLFSRSHEIRRILHNQFVWLQVTSFWSKQSLSVVSFHACCMSVKPKIRVLSIASTVTVVIANQNEICGTAESRSVLASWFWTPRRVLDQIIV